MKYRHIAMALVAALALLTITSCGNSESFEINGTVEELGTQNLRIFYYDGNAMRNLISTAVDSKFRFEGNSKDETVVEIYSNAKVLIGRLVVKNGESLDVTFHRSDPFALKVSGNKNSEALADFLAKNADNLNAAIEAEVAKNPGKPLSAILVNYYYDVAKEPMMADSLLRMLDYTHIPSTISTGLHQLLSPLVLATDTLPGLRLYDLGDSLRVFEAADSGRTFIYFSEAREPADSVVERFEQLADEFAVTAYIRMGYDTIGLHRTASRLPKSTKVYWSPFGVVDTLISRLALPALPYSLTVNSSAAIDSRSEYLPKTSKEDKK